jgi:hypothetical protein
LGDHAEEFFGMNNKKTNCMLSKNNVLLGPICSWQTVLRENNCEAREEAMSEN